MDELRQKVTELTESWKKISEAMQASPQAWQPHLPYSSPAELDEVLSMISYLLDRARAPSGFAPTFRLAKGFAVTSLTNALASFLTDYAVVDRIIAHLKLTFFAERPPPSQVAFQELLLAAEPSSEYLS